MLEEYEKIKEKLKKLVEKDLGMTYEEYKVEQRKEMDRKQKEKLEELKKHLI